MFNRLFILPAGMFILGCTTATSVAPKAVDTSGFLNSLSSLDAKSDKVLSQTASIEGAVADIAAQQKRIADAIELLTPKETPAPQTEETNEVKTAAWEDTRPELFVTYADFNCPPCETLKSDIAAGKFDEFKIVITSGEGLVKPLRPAIRFKWATSDTGYAVFYEYTDKVRDWLKTNLLPKTSSAGLSSDTVISIAGPVAKSSQTDLIALHNQLHGGGSWNWPGDLAEHLRTSHGIDVNTGATPLTGSIFQNYRTVTRTSGWTNLGVVSYRKTRTRWTGNTVRVRSTSCPNCSW